jgi:recombination protein RecA
VPRKPQKGKSVAAKQVAAPAALPKTPVGHLARVLQDHLAVAHAGMVHPASGHAVKIPGVLSTRCETLDAASGRGGFPFSRISVITGGEAVGKTTVGLHLAAEVQSLGGVGLYLDLEHKLDVDYARSLGVNTDELILSQPNTGEQAFAIADSFVTRIREEEGYQDIPVLIFLDSINASTPETTFKAGYDDQQPGAQGRLFSKALPKIAKKMSGLKVAFVMVSQIREKIVQGGGSFREKVSGGNAVKFYAACVLELFRKDWLEVDGRQIGTVVDATFIKNQVAKPFGKARYNVVWGRGIDYHHSLLVRAAELGLASIGAGGWYEVTHPTTGEVFRWQGMGKAFDRVMERNAAPMGEVFADLRSKVRERYA